MIKEYNYSHIITERHQKDVVKLVDKLISSGEWCRGIPKFQTYSNLFDYKELKIFKETFLYSCFNYLDSKKIPCELDSWCYRNNWFNDLLKDKENLWHKHDVHKKQISGIFYLRNPRNEGTEFKEFTINTKPFTWFLYPSYLLHRPPKVKSFRNRYTLAAEFFY